MWPTHRPLAAPCPSSSKAESIDPSRMAELENPEMMSKVISLLSSVLQRVSERNDIDGRFRPQRISVFHGLTKAPISIQSYLERIFTYANCSPSCLIVAYIYLDRFTQNQPFLPITSLNVHRLLITSVLVSAKFMDDTWVPSLFTLIIP